MSRVGICCGESGLSLAGTDVHGVPSSGWRGAQQGQNSALGNANTWRSQGRCVCVWGVLCVCGGDTIMLKENSGQLLRGTGWWLGASRAVSALAKEAEVQGNGTAPMRAGTRK